MKAKKLCAFAARLFAVKPRLFIRGGFNSKVLHSPRDIKMAAIYLVLLAAR